MKKILIAVTLMMALITNACQSNTIVQYAKPEDSQVNPELIKASSLLIVVENIQKTGVTLSYEMATLIKIQEETFLVTHNHWGEMLQDMNILELRDAENKLIRALYASEFKSLIIYQDAGTMVLRAPDGVLEALTPASLYSAPQLKPGDNVQVAYHRQPNRDKVEILEAVIEEISVSRDAPVYTLRSLNGQSLRPGDSGGGVWYHGKLVANTWTVVTKYAVIDATGNIDPDSETLTDKSRAAIFPEAFKKHILSLR